MGTIPYPNQSQIEQSSILSPTTGGVPTAPKEVTEQSTKDQYNFTFFKERSEPPITDTTSQIVESDLPTASEK